MAHSPEEVRKSVRVATGVFGGLLVLTAITVILSRIDLGGGGNYAVGLAIAAAKASLVALFFMHLAGERKAIRGLVGLTMFFFAFALLGPVLGHWGGVEGTRDVQPAVEVAEENH